MKKQVYITTPIYYSSGKPHIGHAYSTFIADALKQYYQLIGFETYFLTGMDEYGQKIQQAAQKANLDPLIFVTKNATIFEDLWDKMGIKYDVFNRTTLPRHHKMVQKIFNYLQSQNLIELGEWKGMYCTSCEENYNLKQAVTNENGLVCQVGHKLEERNEKSYFFKMSQFQSWIQNFFQTHPTFLNPSSRQVELTNNFLKEGLPDLSISRTNFTWGIPVPNDPDHVIYVWIDALFNYLSALGFLSDNDQLYQKFWASKDAKVIHITAKEIARFHAIYWPILLKASGVRIFDELISHGWILVNNVKMSKSLNNSIDPFFILKHFFRDGFRFYLTTFPFHKDNSFSYEELVNCYNHNLVNSYGNLISRLVGMLKKYSNLKTPKFSETKQNEQTKNLDQKLKITVQKFSSLVNGNELNNLIMVVMDLVFETSRLIETCKPWELWKNNQKEEVNAILLVLYKIACFATWALSPILIDGKIKASQILNLDLENINLNTFLTNVFFEEKQVKSEDVILYERVDNNYFDQILNKNNE